MNFPIFEDVRDLLSILHETGFDWIADEIQNVIKEGKAVDTPSEDQNGKPARKSQSDTATVPFSEEEQLAVALGAIREYTVGTVHLLESLPKELSEPLDRSDLSFQILSDDEASLVSFTSNDIGIVVPANAAQALTRLDRALSESWPKLEGSYGHRIKDRNRVVE